MVQMALLKVLWLQQQQCLGKKHVYTSKEQRQADKRASGVGRTLEEAEFTLLSLGQIPELFAIISGFQAQTFEEWDNRSEFENSTMQFIWTSTVGLILHSLIVNNMNVTIK